MNRLSPAFAFKASDVSPEGQFSGYASVYGGPPDAFGDVFLPGAFDASIAEHAQSGSAPAMLWQHDPDQPLGRWLSIRDDGQGLRVKGKLTLTIKRAEEVYELLRAGAATGLSVAGLIPKGGRTCDEKVCTISRLNLLEISITPVPANLRARVLDVKSACGCESIPELQRFFQETFDTTRSQARAMAFACADILRGVEPESMTADQVRALATELDEITKLFKPKRSNSNAFNFVRD